MKVIISWSGSRSRDIARLLADWIPDVLLDVETWMSDHDIQAGSRWADELSAQLENCLFGIVCLTPENSRAPWLLFEAGALSKAVGRARVVPFLFGITPANVEFPLAQFQGVLASREGAFRLIDSINNMRDDPLDATRLQRVFARCWPELARSLDEVPSASPSKPAGRTDRDLLEEILGLLRVSEKNQSTIAARDEELAAPSPSFRWESKLLEVSEADLSAMDDGELEHYRRQLHIHFRRTDSRSEEEALERQQRLAGREFSARKKRIPK